MVNTEMFSVKYTFLIHLMRRIQNKDHIRRTYEINKIFKNCRDDKIYILNNGYDGLALGY